MEREYEFSPLDEIMPNLTITMIYCFQCPTADQKAAVQHLRDGLSELEQKMPFLAGKIVRKTSDSPEGGRPGSLSLAPLKPNSKIDFEVCDLTKSPDQFNYTYEELCKQGMPMSCLEPELFTPGGTYDAASSSAKFFSAKITLIPGGCFVCASASHASVDAWGFVVIMDAWARECRNLESQVGGEDLLPEPITNALPPALVRDVPYERYKELKQETESWKLLGLDWRDLKAEDEIAVPYSSTPEIDISIFRFSAASVEALAEQAIQEEDAMGDDPVLVSSHDALVAFLWRNILKARSPTWINAPHKRDSMVSIALNGRRALYPAIPMTHIGNVVFCCLTELPVKKLIAAKTKLSTIAVALRKSVDAKLDPQVMKNTVDLAKCIPDVRTLGNAFRNWFAEDLVTTSVVDFPVYQTSWGGSLGVPEFFRLPKGQFGGICSMQPRQKDGSIEVFISLGIEEMARLKKDKEFVRRANFVSC